MIIDSVKSGRRLGMEIVMKRILAATVFSLTAFFVAAPQVVLAKTAKECEADYKANKPAIKAAKQKKKDFINACKAGNENTPGAAASPSAAPPAAPAPQAAPAPTHSRATTPPPVARTAPSAANEFQSEAQAKARCPSGTVVWVNTKSRVYHFAGTHNYGTTKSGAYMCESDTAAAGFRAAKNEKHP
jgi:hypothetical protein